MLCVSDHRLHVCDLVQADCSEDGCSFTSLFSVVSADTCIARKGNESMACGLRKLPFLAFFLVGCVAQW